jgi:hypothetical protein
MTVPAHVFLRQAADLVSGTRDRQHGAKCDNFTRISHVWNGWLRARFGRDSPTLEATDVAAMMSYMKLARTLSGEPNEDDYKDACGYAACMGEIASKEGELA